MGREGCDNNMISPWLNLNLKGKIIAVACFVNIVVAIILAMDGKWSCIFSFSVSMFCAFCTYNDAYQYKDADDINNDR